MNVASLIRTGRRLAGDALLDSGVISDPTYTSDGFGGHTIVYVPRPASIRCRVVGVKDQLASASGGLLQGPGTAIILCDFGTDIPEMSRILVNGVLYQIGARLSAESEGTVLERFVGREV